MLFGQNRVNELKQIALFPFLQDQLRVLFAAEAAHFFAGTFGSDRELQFALNRKIEPLLCARFELKSHASRQTQSAQETHRLIRETVDGEGANFAVLDVRKTVGGIKKQSTRCGIQRDSDGVQ